MAPIRSWQWLVIVIVGILAAGPAAAKPTPAAKCLAAKLKAAGKKAVAVVGCNAKAAQKGKPLDPACVTKAEAAFAKAFAKADSGEGCATTGDAGALEAVVDGFVQDVVTALPDAGTKAGGKCAASKQRASAKYASAELVCQAKAALKAVGVDAECIERGETAFEKAFAKAEKKPGCVTVGDVDALDATVDEFVDDVVAAFGSAATTTTITGSTLPASTTTSTLAGPTTHTVHVGPQNTLVFSPKNLTIKAGDTVNWVWDSSFHSVVSGQVTSGVGTADGQFCNSSNTNCASAPLLNAGASYMHTFPTAGTFPYFCAPHASSGMVGTITVQP
jgi:plastocyanin